MILLSILIPTYNYDVFPLVENLQKQAIKTNTTFEVLVFDDASQNHFNNSRINEFENCSFTVLNQNIGRSAIRNLLAKTAKYEWLLFLDADVYPMNNDLISNYLKAYNTLEKVIYGGIRYQDKRPSDNQLLRWIYGNKREALPASIRSEEEHLSFLTLNFFIHKSVFNKVSFNEKIPNLRYEDVLFSYDLQQNNVRIKHIENPVYHLGIESSAVFLEKTKQAIEGLKYLLENNLIDIKYVRLSKYLSLIEKTGTKRLIAFGFKLSKNSLEKHFLSSKPNLFLFDLYRLGYLCSLK